MSRSHPFVHFCPEPPIIGPQLAPSGMKVAPNETVD